MIKPTVLNATKMVNKSTIFNLSEMMENIHMDIVLKIVEMDFMKIKLNLCVSLAMKTAKHVIDHSINSFVAVVMTVNSY